MRSIYEFLIKQHVKINKTDIPQIELKQIIGFWWKDQLGYKMVHSDYIAMYNLLREIEIYNKKFKNNFTSPGDLEGFCYLHDNDYIADFKQEDFEIKEFNTKYLISFKIKDYTIYLPDYHTSKLILDFYKYCKEKND